MKKLYLLLAGALALIAVSCGPTVSLSKIGNPDPTLTGVWVNDSTVLENNGTGEAFDSYTFASDGSFTQNGYMKMEMKDSAATSVTYIDISFSGAGTYGIADGKINFKFKASEGKATLDRFDMEFFDGTSEKDASTTKSIINLILVRPMMGMMKKSMKKDQIYILDSLSEDAFEMTNSSSKDATPSRYVRKR